MRAAWAELLLPLMPPAPARIVDLGCGTGSLSVLLAAAGHNVFGLDFSAGMLGVARHKAANAGTSVGLVLGDAVRAPLRPGTFDAVVVRHLLWAVDDPESALQHWSELLRPRGVLVLIEGRWETGAGIPEEAALEFARRIADDVSLTRLESADLWGRAIRDERYVVVLRAEKK